MGFFGGGAYSGGFIQGAVTPIPNGSSTSINRGSVLMDGSTGYYSYATGSPVNFPNADWYVAALVKLQNPAGTQNLINLGAFGSTNCCALYLTASGADVKLNCKVRGAGAATAITATTATTLSNGFTSIESEYVVVLQNNGGTLELHACPLNGTDVTVGSGAWGAPGTITPATNAFVGARDDVVNFYKNQITWFIKGSNAHLSAAQIQNLAAGQDPIADVGLTLDIYTKFDSAAATLSDSSGNSATATLHGTCYTLGGPNLTTAPINIDSTSVPIWGHVFNRDIGATSKNVTMTGTYKGSPSGIQGRVVNYKTGAVITDWSDCTYPSKGVWNWQRSVNQGGPYRFEVRDKVTTTNIQRSDRPWNVGIVIFVAGHSWMAQFSSTTGTDAGYTYNVDVVSGYTLQSSANWITAINTANVACILNMASRLYDAISIPIGIRSAGQTGTKLYCAAPNNWNTHSGTVLTNAQTVATIQSNAGSNNDFEVILECLGINDARDVATVLATGNYKTADIGLAAELRTYANNLNGRTAANCPIFKVTGGIAYFGGTSSMNVQWTTSTTAITAGTATATPSAMSGTGWSILANQAMLLSDHNTFANTDNVERFTPSSVTGTTFTGTFANNRSSTWSIGGPFIGQHWFAIGDGISAIASTTNCFFAGSSYDVSLADGLHPAAAGFYRVGKRIVQAMANYFLPATFTNGMKGATVTSGSVSSQDITLTFTLADGSTLQGLTGATGLNGFTVTAGDGVTNLPITVTAIPSANTVKLTVTGSITAGTTVSYMNLFSGTLENGLSADVTTVQTNPLYTNGTVTNDTIGIPVQPFSALVVA